MILTIRTDKPEAELGLFEDGQKVAYDTWTAHRELGETLHTRLEVFMQTIGVAWEDIEGIIFYEGPGSFTGLRIGAAVVNAFAYSYDVPVVSISGTNWIDEGIERHANGHFGNAVPEYGADAFTTKPKK